MRFAILDNVIQGSHIQWEPLDRSPVVQWVPLGVDKKSPERRKSSEKLVEDLRIKGWIELKAPEQIPPVRLFATCRTLKNPECPNGTITPTLQVVLGGAYGFTEGYVIDLIAEVPEGSGKFIPVGHRDVKVVRYSGVPEATWANGNFAISRRLVEEWGETTLPHQFDDTIKIADEIWSMNGVDVIGGADVSSDTPPYDKNVLGEFHRKQGIPETLSWRRKGLGKLLIGLELELLRQRGVKKLQLQSVSDELRGIFNEVTSSQDCVFIPTEPSADVQALIAPFLPA